MNEFIVDDIYLDRIMLSANPYENITKDISILGVGDIVTWKRLFRNHGHSYAEVKELCDIVLIEAIEQKYRVTFEVDEWGLNRMRRLFGQGWKELFVKYNNGYGVR